MPARRNPTSLKDRAQQIVCLNFEALCYGTKYAKGTKALADYIHTERFKEIEGPFADWPSPMLQDLIAALYRLKRLKHTSFVGNSFSYIKLVY